MIKKIFLVALAFAFVFAVPLASRVSAGAEKVEICHVNAANDTRPDSNVPNVTVNYGRVIEVAVKAVPAHLDHGDSLTWAPLNPDERDLIEEVYEISLPNANCRFRTRDPV